MHLYLDGFRHHQPTGTLRKLFGGLLRIDHHWSADESSMFVGKMNHQVPWISWIRQNHQVALFFFYSFWVTHQKFLVKPPFKPPLNHGSSWWKHHFWSLKKSHILPMGFSHAFPRWLQRSLNWRQHGGTIEGWRYQQFGLVLLGKFTLW